MLQIIHGNFFGNNERHSFNGEGTTFSNFSWPQPIVTCVATLEPLEVQSPVCKYKITYVNQIEKETPPKNDFLIRVGDAVIVEQFQLLCSFGLKAFFSQYHDTVVTACRKDKLFPSDDNIPFYFVPRFFENIQGNLPEINDFISFVKKVMTLKRATYKLIIPVLRNFVNALEILGYNIDLAYSLIVFVLETLSQNQPKWDDCQEEIREPLDTILNKFPKEAGNEIRQILLQTIHPPLMRGFINFIVTHIDDSFFTKEAPAGNATLRKSELRVALKNTYDMRSKYTHKLQSIQPQLKYLPLGDVIRWENKPYLTIAGLVRLAHHVIRKFIAQQESIEHEEINWRNELPGTVELEVAPQYWVWQHTNFQPALATKKLCGFLEQLEGVLLRDKPLNDLKDLLTKYEEFLPNSQAEFQLHMLTLYVIYHCYVSKQYHLPSYQKVVETYQHHLLDRCSIEGMLTLILIKEAWPWKIEDCEIAWGKYRQQKFQANRLCIPFLFAIGLQNELANQYLAVNNIEKYTDTMNGVILDAAGKANLQSLLMKAKAEKSKITFQTIIEETKKSAHTIISNHLIV